jgi:hypothetical protein
MSPVAISTARGRGQDLNQKPTEKETPQSLLSAKIGAPDFVPDEKASVYARAFTMTNPRNPSPANMSAREPGSGVAVGISTALSLKDPSYLSAEHGVPLPIPMQVRDTLDSVSSFGLEVLPLKS